VVFVDFCGILSYLDFFTMGNKQSYLVTRSRSASVVCDEPRRGTGGRSRHYTITGADAPDVRANILRRKYAYSKHKPSQLLQVNNEVVLSADNTQVLCSTCTGQQHCIHTITLSTPTNSDHSSIGSKQRRKTSDDTFGAKISNDDFDRGSTHTDEASVILSLHRGRSLSGSGQSMLARITKRNNVTVENMMPDTPCLAAIEGRPYVLVNGVPALTPVGPAELAAQDILHDVVYRAFHVRHFASVHSPRRILDVGCGTGRWLMEMSRLYPSARLYGMDLVNQLEEHYSPRGLHLTLADVQDGLPYQTAWFDYVHQQFMRYFIPDNCWLQIIDEFYRICRPEGVVELVECELNVERPDEDTSQLLRALDTVARMAGIAQVATRGLNALLRQVGFVEIRYRCHVVKICNADGSINSQLECYVRRFLRMAQPLVVDRFCLMDAQEYQRLIDAFSTRQQEIGCYLRFYIHMACKPVATN
jgi:ubiquinone/menaquinone biosynthesis C-methylase UbiE